MFGWLLLLAGFSSRAIEQFAQATTLDPTSWYAWYGVVEEHCMSKNYEAVSDPIEKALLYTPTQFTVERLGLQRAAIEAKIRIGEPKIVLPLIQELSIDYPSDPRVVDLHIHCLYGLRNYQGILKLMETHFDKGIRRLTSLRMAQSEISRAYAFIGATDALVSFITPCLEKSSWLYECIPASPWIFAHFAEFVDHFEQFTEKAMELFERILSPEFKTSILQEYKWAHDYPLSTAINHLGSVYSIKVFKLRHNGEDPSIWLLKLQTLVDTYGDPSKMAGGDRVKLWFHLYKAGQDSPDERSVRFMRQYLADHIIRVIEFESKNGGGSWIPSHLAGVGVILLRLGDIENGMIAWAAQFLPDATNTGGLLVEDGSDCMEEPISFPSRFRCDGMCTAQFHEYNTRYKSFYTCLDCWNVEYCGDCLKDLKDGKLSFLKCDPNHHFVQLLPVSREYVGRAVTATEGGWKLNRDWADAIKEKWCDKDADSTMG
jgi:tetratricopeptide (TPR) repeat protein